MDPRSARRDPHGAGRRAGARDVVLVLGRGAQPRLTRTYEGEGIPFDDRVVVREEHARLRR